MSIILVVDDDPALLRVAEATLRRAGHEVVTTTDPETVLSLAIARQVDAVVLDIMMPGRSGYDVLAELRGNPKTASLPVVMLSALSDGPNRVRGLSQGADEYMVKPLEPEELVLRLRRVLAQAQSGTAELEGRLGVLMLGEVLQVVLMSDASGVLEIDGADGRGSLTIDNGHALSATCGTLEGRSAALALLALRRGRFRFVRARPTIKAPSAEPVESISVQGLLFTAAWLDDELGQRPVLDDRELLWPAGPLKGPPPTVEGFESLPLFSVFKAVAASPGVSLGELLGRIPEEPRSIRLTVSILIERGLIQSAREVDHQPPDGTSGDAREPELGVAVDRLIDRARKRGVSTSQIQALVVVGGSIHGALFELRQGIPASALAGQADSLVGAWQAGRPAALPLKGSAGTLVVYLVSTEAETAYRRLRGRLGGFNGGIAAWTASPEEPVGLQWLVDEAERMPLAGGAVAIAEGEETTTVTATLLDGAARWSLHRAAPKTFAALLTLMAAAATSEPSPSPHGP